MPKRSYSRVIYVMLSVIIALFLYFNAIAVQQRNTGNNVAQSQVFTAVVSNIPVTLDYDSDRYFVTSNVNSVDVTLMSANQVRLSQEENESSRSFKVDVNLDRLGVGTHTVPVSLTGLPSDITSTQNPSAIAVTIQKKVTKEFDVAPVVSSDRLPSSKKIDSIRVTPTTVKVTSGAQMMQKIDRVEAVLPTSVSLSGNYTGKITLIAVDAANHPVTAVIKPSEVTMHVTVKTTSSSSSSSSK